MRFGVGGKIVYVGGALVMVSVRGSFVSNDLNASRTIGVIPGMHGGVRGCHSGNSRVVFAESARNRSCLDAPRNGGLPIIRYVGGARN